MTDKKTKKLEEEFHIEECLATCKSIDYLNGLENGVNKRKNISYEEKIDVLKKISQAKAETGYTVK